MEVQEETKSLKNLGGIKSGGGSSAPFIIIGGAMGQKGKHRCFSLWCVSSCDNVNLTYLLRKSVKGAYAVSIT